MEEQCYRNDGFIRYLVYYRTGPRPSCVENAANHRKYLTMFQTATPATSRARSKTRMTAFSFILLSTFIVVGCSSEVRYEPGPIAPDKPVQTKLDKAPVFLKEGKTIRAVARFQLNAKVLGTERYRFSRASKLSPIDLALGWGPMSDQSVVDKMKITQHGRFFYWSSRSQYPVPRRAIIESSSNMHMIPANDEVRKQLLSLRKGELVEIKGFLVNVTGQDGFYWKSSTSRKDTGDGACELVYVQEIQTPASLLAIEV